MCSLTTECVLLLQNMFSYYRMCSAFGLLLLEQQQDMRETEKERDGGGGRERECERGSSKERKRERARARERVLGEQLKFVLICVLMCPYVCLCVGRAGQVRPYMCLCVLMCWESSSNIRCCRLQLSPAGRGVSWWKDEFGGVRDEIWGGEEV
jgi:hypothetical protein